MNYIKSESEWDTHFVYEIVAEPANKLVRFGYSSDLSMIHNNHYKYYRSGFSSIKILEGSSTLSSNSISFRAFNPFFEHFNKVSGDLATGGILIHWESMMLNPRGLKMKVEEIGPQVLTMEHLMFGFHIYLVALAISTAMFLVEVALNCVKKYSMKEKNKKMVGFVKVNPANLD